MGCDLSLLGDAITARKGQSIAITMPLQFDSTPTSAYPLFLITIPKL
ncbi:hypothetical protein AM1_1035 [Acaryochloris marina MBIC11017]|uniref:NHR domain-containing protein n=1 Tax=Acaryochloris marina (strain MBIC 11017) TaxID=329726 RepID=B0C0V1_ACAM1|nr:hypothetical protein AM1_1035 [Acaryochloris marina MBIC11017]